MHKINLIKSKDMFSIISEILDNGGKARITVTGMSMYPFLREGIDSVELSKTNFSEIDLYDIVMIQRKNGNYIMHRIIKKETGSFFIAGDAQQWIEGPIYPEQLVASIKTVWRRDKRIECSNLCWRFLSNLWFKILPFRHIIIPFCRLFHRITCR